MKTITEAISKLSSNRRLADFLFILWAGGAALLSYSLVYTLRKPFTAATFDGIEAFGFDYKVLVTIIQIAGYLIAKFIGIKLISELITILIPKRLAKTSVVRRPSIKLKITPHIQPNDNPLKNMANIL